MKFNEEKVDEYLQLQHVSLVRQCLWGWLIFVLAVGIPASIFGAWKEYTKLILPPIIFSICVWDIWLLINTEKKQKAYILFLGVYCIFLSSLLLLASYKVAYTIDSFPLILYIIVTSLIYITISLCSFFCFRLFLSKPHTNTKKNKTNVAVKII
ncbi:MAG: hypothetical protein VB106_16580, partial [Clostridiaceae bacterium]|nr:hypothetical protein [Clostridiaceae bacterium]